MQLFVGTFVVLGLILVAARFLLRDQGGQLMLPRIVDDSIGMWVLRRLSGHPLGDRRRSGSDAEHQARPPLPFDAGMALRLGIRRASDLVPPRPLPAGAWLEPTAPARGPVRRGLGPWQIGTLAVAAIIVGLVLGAGAAMLVPQGGVLGITATPESTAGSTTSPTPAR